MDTNTAIIVSEVKVNLVLPDGRVLNDTLRTTSVVAKRGKDWICVYHTDMDIKTMP